MGEIKFFEEEQEDLGHFEYGGFEEKPPHDDTHIACSRPNPPHWCNQDSSGVNIDQGLVLLFVIGLMIILYNKIK